MTKLQQHKFLASNIIDNLVKNVMHDRVCDILTAMKRVYQSPVVNWLQDNDYDLTSQSSAYAYELLKRYPTKESIME